MEEGKVTDDMIGRLEVLRMNSIQNRSLSIMRQRRQRIVKRKESHVYISSDFDIRQREWPEKMCGQPKVDERTENESDSDDGFTSDVSDYVTADEKDQLIPDKADEQNLQCVFCRKNSVQERLWRIRQLRRVRMTRSQILLEA